MAHDLVCLMQGCQTSASAGVSHLRCQLPHRCISFLHKSSCVLSRGARVTCYQRCLGLAHAHLHQTGAFIARLRLGFANEQECRQPIRNSWFE